MLPRLALLPKVNVDWVVGFPFMSVLDASDVTMAAKLFPDESIKLQFMGLLRPLFTQTEKLPVESTFAVAVVGGFVSVVQVTEVPLKLVVWIFAISVVRSKVGFTIRATVPAAEREPETVTELDGVAISLLLPQAVANNNKAIDEAIAESEPVFSERVKRILVFKFNAFILTSP